ncbi:MAG: hypothetical protein AMXMBFR33_29950 [Candidatus Xenobia bacterium]
MKKRARLFERISRGLKQGIAHERGEMELRATRHQVPLPPLSHEYGPEEVRSLRERLGMGQSQFAAIFLVSVKTVQSWEQGTRSPSPTASRLLQLIEDPGARLGLLELAVR